MQHNCLLKATRQMAITRKPIPISNYLIFTRLRNKNFPCIALFEKAWFNKMKTSEKKPQSLIFEVF